ncbi:MAG: FtsW/RodA/SpoVE family cell cycle protein, partial [Alphaproteobacteria bacterium]|nr:FtsW/RodA/SpoVE family cell cycle protein [Alphaproteobacteria bacterium]
MNMFARTDKSLVARWWWTVDLWTLAAIAALIIFGLLLTVAASPPVAERIGLDSFHFVRRQILFLVPSVLILISVSMLSPRSVRRLAAILFLGTLALMGLTLVVGTEVKGALRWISFGGLSLQPSEFVKPAFAVVAAWMIAEARKDEGFPGFTIAAGLFAIVFALLVAQPDMGMAAIVAAVWCAQLFLAGLPMLWAGGLFVLGVTGSVGAYFLFPHVQSRVDRFINPSSGDNYQIEKALQAFANGGLFGRGPGEGRVKEVLPDAHADFVFAVAGEELGLIACLIVVALFAFVVLRGFGRLMRARSLF